ncbi:MAG TPA: hypothetical protein VGX76_01985 [Pirellulales bacterium]|nr:hypothetical protein [Pirellulales bacterium]
MKTGTETLELSKAYTRPKTTHVAGSRGLASWIFAHRPTAEGAERGVKASSAEISTVLCGMADANANRGTRADGIEGKWKCDCFFIVQYE